MLKLEGEDFKFAVQCIITKKNGLKTELKSSVPFTDLEKLESVSEAVYSDLMAQIFKCTLEVY